MEELVAKFREHMLNAAREYARENADAIQRVLDESYGDDGPVFEFEDAFYSSFKETSQVDPSAIVMETMNVIIATVDPTFPTPERMYAPTTPREEA